MSLGKRPQPGAKRPEPHVSGTPAPDIDGDFVHQASLYSFADQLKDMGGTAISIVPGDASTYDPLRFCGPTPAADRSSGALSESVESMYRSVTNPLVAVEPGLHFMFERFLKPQEPIDPNSRVGIAMARAEADLDAFEASGQRAQFDTDFQRRWGVPVEPIQQTEFDCFIHFEPDEAPEPNQ